MGMTPEEMEKEIITLKRRVRKLRKREAGKLQLLGGDFPYQFPLSSRFKKDDDVVIVASGTYMEGGRFPLGIVASAKWNGQAMEVTMVGTTVKGGGVAANADVTISWIAIV